MNTLFFKKYILILLSIVCGGVLVPAGQVHAATISASPQTMATSSCSTGLSCGLVGYWTFDGKDINRGTNTMIDRSGNGNTATLENMSTTTSPIAGTVGQALRFDGVNDAVNAGSGSSLDDIQLQGGGGMTVSFWIRPASNATKTIIAKAPASGGTGRWSITKSSNTNPARMSFSKQGTVTSNKNYNSLLTTGVWQHIVLTWNGSMTTSTGVVVYKNSVLQVNLTATDGSGATSEAAGTLCISADPTSATPTICNASGTFGDQDLDDIRIYNRVISTSEIQQLYNIGLVKQSASPVVTATSSCSTGLSCGLTGYWTFDGKDMLNGVARDTSGNGNNGSLINIATSTLYVPGMIGQGLMVDGINDYVNTAKNLSVFMSSSTGSISVWAKPRGTQSVPAGCVNGGGNMIFSDGFSSGGGYAWLGFDSANACAGLYNGSSINMKVNTTYTRDKWVHLVWIHTGGVLSLYKDGVFVNSIVAGNIGNMAASLVTFGKGYSASGNLFKGTMDEIRVYNRALSSTEILQLYNIGAATKQAASPITTATSSCSIGLSCGLIGYWTFDGKDTPWTSATAATTLDKSGGGSTGTLTSMIRDWTPVPGAIGQGFQMDGTADYVEVADKNAYTFSTGDAVDTPFTFSMWVKRRGANTVSDAFISKTTTTAGGTPFEYSWGISNSTGKMSINLYDNSGSHRINKTSDSSYDTDIGKWTHYAVTYTGSGINSGITLYRNGIAISATGGSSGTYVAMHNSTQTLKLGARWISDATNKGFLNGAMDEVRIYDRALSATEILWLYNLGR